MEGYFNIIKMFTKLALGGVLLMLLSCAEEKKERKIVCWGDSLTAPPLVDKSFKGLLKSLIYGDFSYPAFLQEGIGDDYEIINAGVGGENTLSIMARQGASPAILNQDIVIYSDKHQQFDIMIGSNIHMPFVSSWNRKVISLGTQHTWPIARSSMINPCSIGGKEFVLRVNHNFWAEKFRNNVSYCEESYYYLDKRFEQLRTDTIRKGTILKTKAMRELRGAYCSIFFIGQNGGYSCTRELIAQLNAMIKYSKSKHFIVISHHVPNQVEKNAKEMCAMEDSLAQAFGSSFINLRQYLVSSGLHDAGLVPTDEDIVAVKQGNCPPQLLKDGTHFTKDGYKLIAKLVEDKIKMMNNE